MMLHALLGDLGQVPGIALVTLETQAAPGTMDAPRAPWMHAAPGAFQRRFDACVQAADAVWPLAPEAGGMLERLSRQVLRHQRILLGSQPQALRVAGSRLRTARVLARAGIAVVPTYAPGQPRPATNNAWVVKPDVGADYEDTRIFSTAEAALAWISDRAGYVLQPFIPGKLGSLSLLCRDGAAQLLGCNEHRIAVRDNQFHLLGTTVNSLPDNDGAFARLGQKVARALPGLWGHAGIDFVLAEHGITVLAVHARMTPSYAGLHASLGCNPAAMVLDLLTPPCGASSVGTARSQVKPVAVSVDVAAFDGA
jgi:predicted ATP-grasp superfamily ATP-dependent carboligase